jgi:hypothetical protein
MAIAHYRDDGGKIETDPRTGVIYDPDVEAARRAAYTKWLRRYGHPQAHHSPYPAVQRPSPVGTR